MPEHYYEDDDDLDEEEKKRKMYGRPRRRLRRLKISKVDRVTQGSNPGALALVFKSSDHEDGTASEGEALINNTQEQTMSDENITPEEGQVFEGLDAKVEDLQAQLAAANADLAALGEMSLDQLADYFGIDVPAEAPSEEPELADSMMKGLPEEVQERIAKAELRVAAMEDAERLRSFVEVAKADLGALTADADELGAALKAVADSCGQESDAYKLLERVLKGAAAQAGQAEEVLLQQSAAEGTDTVGNAEEAIMKATAELQRSEGLDIGQAMSKVRQADPGLFAAYETERAERRARR